MDTNHLVKMANQIGDFFDAWPDRAEAAGEIVNHLRKFWSPCMRSELLQHVDDRQGEGLKEFVLSAIRMHREKLGVRG